MTPAIDFATEEGHLGLWLETALKGEVINYQRQPGGIIAFAIQTGVNPELLSPDELDQVRQLAAPAGRIVRMLKIPNGGGVLVQLEPK